MDPSLVSTSTFLSLVLRHDPVWIAVELDPAGWVEVDGHAFYRSDNGVWLTEAIPALHLRFPAGAEG